MNAMTADFEADTRSSPVLGFFRSEEARIAIAKAFGDPGLGELTLTEGGLDVALKVMRRGNKPRLLIYDTGNSANPAADIATLVKHGGRGLPVIAVGGTIDIQQFRQLVVAGAFDYVDHGLGPTVLAEAAARAGRQRARRATDTGPARSGRLIVFCGSRGGVGTTSAAIGTAWTLAHQSGINTALLDLDLSQGTMAFALDIDPGRGLREGLDQPARIDAVFLERCLVREGPNLAIFSGEEPYDTAGDIDAAAAVILLDELKQTFDCIVVDLPRATSPLNRAVLAAADDIVVVTSATLASLRDAIRWADYIASVADRAVVRVVQVATSGTVPLPKAEFEKSLGRKVDVTIPFDARTAAAANNDGKAMPAVAPEGGIGKAIAELVALLGFAPAEAAAPKGFRWPWQDRNAQS